MPSVYAFSVAKGLFVWHTRTSVQSSQEKNKKREETHKAQDTERSRAIPPHASSIESEGGGFLALDGELS